MELNGMNIIALLTIVVLIISISLAIISLIGLDLQRTVPKQIQETYTKLVLSLFQKSPYNVCEALSGKQIFYQEFQNLLLAVYNGHCGDTHASVTLSRSYSKEDIERVARINAIADDGKLIYYREAVPFGVGGLIIQGNPGYFPLKKWDTIDVWSAGKPTADTMINITEQGCDPYDDICQAGCTYKKICDPVCDDGKRYDITCNIACIDTAGDGIDIKDMEVRVAANKCNPDCYANRTNPFKAYDPGCVWRFKEQRDDICDPNSNGVIDGVCDPDCINTKNICDFDCNGTVYNENPMGLKDEKCLVCDGECNGWCSPACNKNAVEGMAGYDPDCRKEVVHNFWCSGDGLCENDKGENCENSVDCKQICDDQNLICCPKFSDSDYAGCTASKDLKEGSLCSCSNQCGQLKCDETGHCCPEGKTWNGTSCEVDYRFTILFIPVQWNSGQSNFESYTDMQANFFISAFPFKDCPQSVKVIKAWDLKSCGDTLNLHCENFNCPQPGLQEIETCADTNYRGKYDRVIGLTESEPCGAGGFSCAFMQPKPVVVLKDGEQITAHELGHTYGLCDEYSGCVWELQNSEWGECPNPRACDCCNPSPYEGLPCCNGRAIPGGYCAMGPYGIPVPGFCSYCFNHLASILKCS